jgi:phosphoglycolate phosphatase-like HAD superfamily hydrolase
MKKRKLYLCFDFDGTLVDSFEILVEKVQHLAPEFGYKPVSKEEAERLRKSDPVEIFNSLNVLPSKLPLLAARMRAEMGKEMHRMAPVKGIPETLTTLHRKRYPLGLVSSNSEENVKTFLTSHQLDFFGFFVCGCSLLGKAAALEKVLQEMLLEPEKMIYIADEIRDAEAAREVGVRFGAVSWGYSPLESLNTYKPDYVFRNPKDIVTILTQGRTNAPG